MGIPIGKLSLYIACAGIHPEATLPITLDCGTSNAQLREDPLYLGLKQERCSKEEEKALVQEFMEASATKWPNIVVQFEDGSTELAFDLLDQHAPKYPVFNDDIQVYPSSFINSCTEASMIRAPAL